MKIVSTLAQLRLALSTPQSCVLVPTMGNLHAGHLSLVEKALEHQLPVVVSIFVNRLQFAPHEDFDRYPRTLEQDVEKLRAAGAHFVFAPSETELYAQPQVSVVTIFDQLADILEGAFRPGFFTGVATVVMKLFQCVQPKVAVFGRKDYQQLKVIEHMVEQFLMPVAIESVATCRNPQGLALSSRNAYLSDTEQQQASALFQALQDLAVQYQTTPLQRLSHEAQAAADLQSKGWQVDYLTVRSSQNLQTPAHHQQPQQLVALGAASLGGVRLIDNLEFGMKAS
jgi:pantoate--beta-alanine ligase